uniref:TFIIS central domain-containing protein n=1 Tax=Elaeophora elaphi TaxID=1147741 RepID=A0A0R3RUZ1_9BILA
FKILFLVFLKFLADLSSFERDELIALVIHLKNELNKKERWKNNCNTKSGQCRQDDASPMYNRKLLPVKQKFEKPANQLRTKNKLNNGTEEKLRAEIIKFHSDDEEQGITVSKVKMTESSKVATPVEESEPNADGWESDDSYTRNSSSGTESVFGQVEEENGIAEQRQQILDNQTENASKISQKNQEKDDDSEDQSDDEAFVGSSTERSTFEDNQDEHKEISDDAENDQFVKESSNDCSDDQEWTEEKEFSSDAQEQLEKKMIPVKKAETQEDKIKVDDTEEVESKKDGVRKYVGDSLALLREVKESWKRVTSNFVFRSIIRMTSAHVKRSELLIAKNNSC